MEYQRIKKSKWDSQRVHKVFKNRHGKQEWRNNLNETGRVELKSFCVQRQKNQLRVYDENYANDDYTNYNNIPKWICNRCTYYNSERNGYCSICQFSFKQSASYKYTNDKHIVKSTTNNAIAFGEYLKPILQQIQNKQDNMDESIQLAISMSLNDIIDTQSAASNEYNDGKDDSQSDNEPKTQIIIKSEFIVKKGYFAQKLQPKTVNKNSSYHSYWREMSAFRDTFNNNYNRYSRKNTINAVRMRLRSEKKKEDAHDDDPNFPKGAKGLLYNSAKLWNFIPSIKEVRRGLEEQYNAKSFYIRSIATPLTVRRFLRGNGGARGNDDLGKLEVVYHGSASRNDESIMRSGLVVGGTKGVVVAHGRAYGKGVYCSPYLGTAGGYQRGSMFVCVARSNVCHKSGHIYVVPHDYDILPLYLASFEYDGSCYAPVVLNNMILIAQHNFRPLNIYDIKKRTVQRKWSAYHKLMKYNI